MDNDQIESIMAKYLENKSTEIETQMILDHLMSSERDRHIINLAAAGLQSMSPFLRQQKE